MQSYQLVSVAFQEITKHKCTHFGGTKNISNKITGKGWVEGFRSYDRFSGGGAVRPPGSLFGMQIYIYIRIDTTISILTFWAFTDFWKMSTGKLTIFPAVEPHDKYLILKLKSPNLGFRVSSTDGLSFRLPVSATTVNTFLFCPNNISTDVVLCFAFYMSIIFSVSI